MKTKIFALSDGTATEFIWAGQLHHSQMNEKTMKRILSLCFAIAFLTLNPAYAQDSSCSDLLRHGIYDYFRETGDSSSYARTQREVCEAYNSLRRDIAANSAKASYGLFGGGASFNRDQLEAVGRQMCGRDISESSTTNLMEKASQVINPAAVAAYSECVARSNLGIKATTSYTQDDVGVKAITLTLSYTIRDGLTQTPELRGIIMTPEQAFSCSGDLWDAERNTPMTTRAHTMTCTRRISPVPFTEQNRKLFAPAATLTVSTSAGAITRQVTPIYAPPPAEIERRLSELEKTIEQLNRTVIKDVQFFQVEAKADVHQRTVETLAVFPEDVDAVALESLMNDGHHLHIAKIDRVDRRTFKVTFYRSDRGENDRWIPVIRLIGIKLKR